LGSHRKGSWLGSRPGQLENNSESKSDNSESEIEQQQSDERRSNRQRKEDRLR
jgi:hypothetical protein